MSEYFQKYIKADYFERKPSTIKFKTTFRNCVLDALKAKGYKETQTDNWDITWVDQCHVYTMLLHQHLKPHQRINHFRNHQELTRKDNLMRNIRKYKKELNKFNRTEESKKLNFLPVTFQLPSEYQQFCEEFKHHNSNNTFWIMKPIGKCQGRGIFLFNKLK